MKYCFYTLAIAMLAASCQSQADRIAQRDKTIEKSITDAIRLKYPEAVTEQIDVYYLDSLTVAEAIEMDRAFLEHGRKWFTNWIKEKKEKLANIDKTQDGQSKEQLKTELADDSARLVFINKQLDSLRNAFVKPGVEEFGGYAAKASLSFITKDGRKKDEVAYILNKKGEVEKGVLHEYITGIK